MGQTAKGRAEALYKLKMMVMTALFIALGYAATSLLTIPTPGGGYLNLGDTIVLLGACLLGPVYGAAAGGLGPALADLLLGYGIYVPATLVIKSLMGVTAALLYRALRKKIWAVILSGAVAEAIMVAGYYLFESALAGNPAAGLAGVPGNLIQAAFSVVTSVLLTGALKKSAAVRRQFPDF